MNQLVEEIKKAELLLSATKNLDKKSFYEGYIKGLKYGKEALELQRQVIVEAIEVYEDFEIGDFGSGKEAGRRQAVEIIKSIK